MALVYIPLRPGDALPLAANFAAYLKTNGTNIPIAGLAFDATTSEASFWSFRAVNYASGNLTLSIDWYADTATSGTVTWAAQIAAITPDTDSQDIETDALATVQSVTDTHLGTTGQRVHRCSVTISNLDSLAQDDLVFLKIARDIADTMTGDSIMVMAVISYTSV
jgi:hypothetical protein